MTDQYPPDRFCLDDLSVGQRFTSAAHTLDEAEIKAFAAKTDEMVKMHLSMIEGIQTKMK